ncbi:choice-of-anchor K domain-containing protein [Nostoc sp. 106C]|uniref:choice-of-anchor K domain-containing protein n=1 Tax=Nostoc sp. 106C TaxID=1932667 RepID=UPI000A36AC67|nr:choice-of-anchor K domain-containing protein [Nostoc sp. 106C]OUL29592.1 hypothetical protein BV375_15395 [Nostoc sp. 106C]
MKLSLVFATALSSCSMIAFTAFGFSGQAQAFTIAGRADGVWVNPIPDSKNKFCSNSNTNCQFVQGVGNNLFSWGEPAQNTPPNRPNQLTFIGNSFLADVGSWFKLGSLNYFNGIIYDDTNIQYVTLNISLSLDDNNQVSKLLPISFYLENTTNQIKDNLKDPRNADSVYINTTSARTSFKLNQNSYIFQISGFSPLLSSSQTSISANEGEFQDAAIYARFIKPNGVDNIPPRKDVPEASTIAASFLGVAYLIYRKKFSKLTAKFSCK